jgi:leucyl-tRNA synthetase
MHKYKEGDMNAELFRFALKTLIIILSPLTPHVCEEMWEHIGADGLVYDQSWPGYDEQALKLDSIEIVVQVNGKLKDKMKIASDAGKEDMEKAAKDIFQKYGCSVLLKGGHNLNDANDFLLTETEEVWFAGKRIENPNTHGTGCTLSSAIASNLAKGKSIKDAVQNAKDYISNALSAMLDLGKGSGPLNHGYMIKNNGLCYEHKPLFYNVKTVETCQASFARASLMRRIASIIFSSLVA